MSGLRKRRETKSVRCGSVWIGSNHPVTVQSMTTTDTRDIDQTVKQIQMLDENGCEIVRVAVPDFEAAEALGPIKKKIGIPLIADIHFNYQLALEAIKQGIDGLRINPGNIGSEQGIAVLAKTAKKGGVPIRIGVNSGSLEKDLLIRHGRASAEAMCESALRHMSVLEKHGYEDIIISLKSTDVHTTIDAYLRISEQIPYPLHIGITEAGPYASGSVKSAVGMGILLHSGIGDTIRVSLTGDPSEEVRVGWDILVSLGLRQRGIDLISCPTCGRCEIDLSAVAEEVEKRTKGIRIPLKVAVMGCVVNGPGEAKEADVGLAGGRQEGVLFSKGEVIKKVPEKEIVPELMKEIKRLVQDKTGK